MMYSIYFLLITEWIIVFALVFLCFVVALNSVGKEKTDKGCRKEAQNGKGASDV